MIVDSGYLKRKRWRRGTPHARAAEIYRAVHEAFLPLPADWREAMTLFIHEGMIYAEIAAVGSCSPKAVETRVCWARQILKERLKALRA